MSRKLAPLGALRPKTFETTAILKATTAASRRLAKLKGVVGIIPNQGILINTLALQEAEDSSAIENIVTSHDELFKSTTFPTRQSAFRLKRYATTPTHCVLVIRPSVPRDYSRMRKFEIQATIEGNSAGFWVLPGTVALAQVLINAEERPT